jgi:hypothetical protein
MTSHSYCVGQHVIYSEQGLSGGIWSGEYEVNGLLAGGGENPLYQLTCADQSHHRIVSEHEITAMPALAMTNLLTSLRLEEPHSRRRQRPMLTDPALLEL